MTDAAINMFPTLEDKVHIVQNAIDLAQVLGIATPKVAILSAVETINPKIQSTVDAATLCKMADRGQIIGGVLDGPLAFDNAVSDGVGAHEEDRVAGGRPGRHPARARSRGGQHAGKAAAVSGRRRQRGHRAGRAVPIVLTSRADSVRTRLASAAVMALVADARREKSSASEA